MPSRGSIIPRILEGLDGVGPARLPDALDFSAYPSFTLLVASKDGGEILRWRRGAGLTREVVVPGFTFLTSSSWREPDVALWRRQAFDSWRAAAGEPETHGLPTFHVVAPAGDESSAPFMTRSESATRSITQVRVDRIARRASPDVVAASGALTVIDPASPAGVVGSRSLAPSAALIADDEPV